MRLARESSVLPLLRCGGTAPPRSALKTWQLRPGSPSRRCSASLACKSALMASASTQLRDRILEQRESAAPGDLAGTVSALFDHYEDMGDFIIRTWRTKRSFLSSAGRSNWAAGRTGIHAAPVCTATRTKRGPRTRPRGTRDRLRCLYLEAPPARRGDKQGRRRGVRPIPRVPNPAGWMT